MAPDEQEVPSQPTDPIEAYAKLVGLPTGTCPGLRFYATSLPLTIGSGAMHVQSWAHGDHCMVGQDAAVATAHLELIFEPLSLSHEVRVLEEPGVRIDGVHYGRKALVRVISGSTVRIGAYEIAILFPHPARGTPPPPLPMPALAGAGGDAPPPMGLAELATNALRDTAGGLLTLGEVEEWARRVYPHVRASCQGPARREEWRASMMRALQARPDLVVERERHSSEHGKGLVFQLHPAVAQAHAQALAQAKALALAQEQEKQRQEQEKQRQQQAAQQALQQAQQEALLEAQQQRRFALEAAAAAAQPSAEKAQQHLYAQARARATAGFAPSGVLPAAAAAPASQLQPQQMPQQVPQMYQQQQQMYQQQQQQQQQGFQQHLQQQLLQQQQQQQQQLLFMQRLQQQQQQATAGLPAAGAPTILPPKRTADQMLPANVSTLPLPTGFPMRPLAAPPATAMRPLPGHLVGAPSTGAVGGSTPASMAAAIAMVPPGLPRPQPLRGFPPQPP